MGSILPERALHIFEHAFDSYTTITAVPALFSE